LPGLIIDVLIAYLIKQIIRLRRLWGSGRLKLVTAKIETSIFDDEWVWNCPTVHVTYTYQFNGQSYFGEDSKPFFFTRMGEIDAEQFKPGETAVVRVNPQQPQRSVLRRADQMSPVSAAD
jgi:hypothetical protein